MKSVQWHKLNLLSKSIYVSETSLCWVE